MPGRWRHILAIVLLPGMVTGLIPALIVRDKADFTLARSMVGGIIIMA